MKQKRNKNIIFIALTFIVVLLIIAYTVQANSVATSGYNLQDYKNKIISLQSENTNLELKLSKVKSLNALEEKVADLGMLKAEKIEYISITSEVAVR